MADFKKHAIIGGVTGAAITILTFALEKRKNPEAKISFGSLLLNTTLGVIGSCLPDLMEPARNPNHRKFFHSFAFATLTHSLTNDFLRSSAGEEYKVMVRNSWFGYLSHLAADLTTTRGLPII